MDHAPGPTPLRLFTSAWPFRGETAWNWSWNNSHQILVQVLNSVIRGIRRPPREGHLSRQFGASQEAAAYSARDQNCFLKRLEHFVLAMYTAVPCIHQSKLRRTVRVSSPCFGHCFLERFSLLRCAVVKQVVVSTTRLWQLDLWS